MHRDAEGLDLLPAAQIASVLAEGQLAALAVIRQALPDIARGGEAMAEALSRNGRLVYAAAGSSGLMAMADACELQGTFGIPPERISILMAGGLPQGASMPGDTEDATVDAERAAEGIGPDDAVILISASGTTPYPMTIKTIAEARGAATICIANNAGAPLLRGARVAICLPTPAEVIAGSTRMGAGTVQKAALNMMSTIMGVRLGHVHDGMMVNVQADNAKLRQRAAAMVASIGRVPDAQARDFLERASGNVKTAILLAAGATSPDAANHMLAQAGGQLRPALAALTDRS